MTINPNIFDEDLNSYSFPIFELNRLHKSSFIEAFKTFLKLKHLLSEIKPDFLVAHCELPETFAAFLFGRWKTIICLHSVKAYTGHRLIGKLVRNILFLRNVNWVRVTDAIRLDSVSDISINTIPNPILHYNSKSSSPMTFQKLNRLVFIGRISKIAKRPDLAIEIAKNTKLPLLLVGDGDWKSSLEKQTTTIWPAITFVGFKANPWQYLLPGDLIVLTSDWEGEPLLIFEIYLRQLPVLVRDIPEFRKLGLPEFNYCATPADFTNKIQNLTMLENLVIKSSKMEEIVQSRKVNNITKMWKSYFIELM